MDDRVTVLVVGNTAVRAAVRAILETDGRLHVIAEADDGHEARRAYRVRPARVVVVCQRNSEGDALDTAREIGDEAPEARIIVLGRVRGALGGTRALRLEAAESLTGVAVEAGGR